MKTYCDILVIKLHRLSNELTKRTYCERKLVDLLNEIEDKFISHDETPPPQKKPYDFPLCAKFTFLSSKNIINISVSSLFQYIYLF